ncbi:MAG: hypothetical protein Q4D62_06140 [Planctomycetia bacterium]|nr:hypothetical protein [Planctomycetia bacterium]
MKNIREKLRCMVVLLIPVWLLGGVSFWLNGKASSTIFPVEQEEITCWEEMEECSRETILEAIAAYEDSLSLVSPRVGQEVQVEKTSSLTTTPATEIVVEKESEPSLIPQVAAPPALVTRPTANIWQISTVRMSTMNPTDAQMSRISVHQWEGEQWIPRDLADFYACQHPGEPVLFFIHGNRVSANEALAEGVRLLRCFPAHPQIRLVIWHWRADRVSRRPRPEYTTKAIYADYQGYYLARVLRGMREDASILLAGHSFGARTILSGLHLLGGGGYGGRFLDSPSEGVALDIQAFLIAAATHRTDFIPNGKFHQSLNMAQKIYITQNSRDPALKLYPKMAAGGRLPEAMGYAGPATWGISAENIRKLQILSLAFPSHSVEDYLAQPNVRGTLYHTPLVTILPGEEP